MKAARQTTLRDIATVTGIGVHSGLPVTLSIHPADANYGISFMRTGIEGCADREVRANVRAVTATEFATVLGDAHGPLCSTAEHVLAALSGLGVDNALIEIDGPEVPIMDGSAAAFVAAIEQAGIVTLSRRAATSRFSSRCGSPVATASANCGLSARLPPRSRDRLRQRPDRPPEHRPGPDARDVPQGSGAGRTFRLHARCLQVVERRLCAGRDLREHARGLRQPGAQRRRTSIRRRIRAPQGARRDRDLALASARCSGPIAPSAAAISSITRCCAP